MFHILCDLCRGLFPNFSLRTRFSLMKQSVAAESTRAFMSAMALLVLMQAGMGMARDRAVIICSSSPTLLSPTTASRPSVDCGVQLLLVLFGLLPVCWGQLHLKCPF